MKRKISILFKELCCSVCKSDFDENSILIMREEKNKNEEMIVLKLICPTCGKNFGVAFLGMSDLKLKNHSDEDFILKVQGGANPINSDDVLDAHKFIKKLDKDWQKFISGLNNN
jgi:hypothetical protein